MSDVRQRAVGKWLGILSNLGIADDVLSGKHGPCPFCGGKDRFRFTDHEQQGRYFCSQCGSGSGFDLLMNYHNWDFATAASEVERIVGGLKEVEKKKSDPSKRLRKIQETATKPGTAVVTYLKNRGLSTVPPGLLQGNDGYFEDGKKLGSYLVMLGKVVSQHNKPLTWHVTYLENGRKAPVGHPKKIMKAVGDINGGAIRLWPLCEHIGIAEGIESAIAAYELYGIPMWSVMNSTCMERFIVPDEVRTVSIFADNDKTYTGQRAAYSLANRLVVRNGINADVFIPRAAGDDFLDELIRSRGRKTA